ncbi:MAG: hypothetical protein QT00_C0001G0452 [archaeon GW2011_AR5]|nr:MAG: hypothetical protein QT00_C0001G0452 [archaeon GW2011_AR5]
MHTKPNRQNDIDRYVDSIVVYRGRSRFLRHDEAGFYVDAAHLTRKGYAPTGEVHRLAPGDMIVVHGKKTLHLNV